jgi:WD40 repeat-containing protein SMU1
MALDVEASDVIRIVLQFCKENNLTQSYAALANETQCSLNTVDSVEGFVGDVRNGRWDLVLPQVADMRLPKRKLEDLYEQVAVETMECHELDAARSLLRETATMTAMRAEQPERHARLERLLERASVNQLNETHAYPEGTSREKRRAALARALASEVFESPPSRLLALLGQAFKWQSSRGYLKSGENFDVFFDRPTRAIAEEEETFPVELHKHIKLGKKNRAEAIAFSPDGRSLAVGSNDGFVEVYDWETGKLRLDLAYQKEEMFMMHDDAVSCVDFAPLASMDLLVSGSADGKIKAWRIGSGACLRKFDRAHAEGVASARFSSDAAHVLSASFDGVVKIHGLKSGKTLREFRGHASFVNDARYSNDGSKVVSCSSDGTVRVWDARTGEEKRRFAPPQPGFAAKTGADAPIAATLVMNPEGDGEDVFLVVPRNGDAAHVATADGKVTRTFACEGILEDGAIVAAAVSGRGEFVYLLGRDGAVHCFSTASGKREHVLRTEDADALGMCHHPRRNALATFAAGGGVKLWKP